MDFFLCVIYSPYGENQYKSLQRKTSSKAKQVRQGVWLQGRQGNQEDVLQKEAQFAQERCGKNTKEAWTEGTCSAKGYVQEDGTRLEEIAINV